MPFERLPGLGENRWLAGSWLKATKDHADIKRIEFDPAANATSLLGGDGSRAGAEEGVHDALSRCPSISAKCQRLRNCQATATAVRQVSIASARSTRRV